MNPLHYFPQGDNSALSAASAVASVQQLSCVQWPLCHKTTVTAIHTVQTRTTTATKQSGEASNKVTHNATQHNNNLKIISLKTY